MTAKACLASGLLAFWLLPVVAQNSRDPTQPYRSPAEVRSGLMLRSEAQDIQPVSVIVSNGKPYVVVGSRLHGVGDKFAGATIERISETELWLRDGKEIHKIALHAGIRRTPHVATKE